MKYKELALSIILYAFIGFLWLLFMNHILNLDNGLFKVVGFLLGTILFGEIVRRITPFHEYKITHPIKIAGFCASLLVVLLGVFVFDFV